MSKSTKRRRSVLRQTWLTPDEDALIRRKAAVTGVTLSELQRIALFGYKPPPTRTDREALVKLSAGLGRVGSSLNQIAKHLNAGRPGDRVEGVLGEALRELLEWRTMVMQALGYERHRKDDDED
jgi:hypothetical protein